MYEILLYELIISKKYTIPVVPQGYKLHETTSAEGFG